MNKRLSPPKLPKIGKLLYASFTLNDYSKYKKLKKMRLVKLCNLHIIYPNEKTSKFQVILEALLKYKPYKALKFENLLEKEIPIKKQIKFAKKHFRIKRLVAPLESIYEISNLKTVLIWLKYAKHLKEFYCRNNGKKPEYQCIIPLLMDAEYFGSN